MSDLFSATDDQVDIERAKAILRDQPEREQGFKLGSISYLQRKMGISYGDAWGIMDELVETGFISEADEHGRRTVETLGQMRRSGRGEVPL